MWHGIIIGPLVVPKIFCVSRIHSWLNILDPVGKIQTMMRMKVYSNKGILLEFGRKFWIYVETILMKFCWMIWPCNFIRSICVRFLVALLFYSPVIYHMLDWKFLYQPRPSYLWSSPLKKPWGLQWNYSYTWNLRVWGISTTQGNHVSPAD